MSEEIHPIEQLLTSDKRYRLDAYQFVRDALGYAQDVLKVKHETADETVDEESLPPERHITGQQLCESIRLYAQDQYGLMAKVVLNSWGIHSTGDFGEIVYNLINIQCMKKSENDRREDFDDVYDFEEVFQQQFQITEQD